MKSLKLFFTSSFLLLAILVFAQSEVLTNEIIIEMKTKGLPSSVILSKIKSSQNSFDISTEKLINLADMKIGEDVINAVVEAAGDNGRHVVKIDPNNPLDMHTPGIYYFKQTEMVSLEPTVYSQAKSGGAMMFALTSGLTKVKDLVSIDGSNSRVQFKEVSPEFYFYFDPSKNSFSNDESLWWFSVATSPNEFLLTDMKVKKTNREIEVGSASLLKESVGVADKNKTKFNFQKLAPGIYKVFFDEPLLSGEYSFMYAGNVPEGFSKIDKVYDFGID